MKNLKNERGQSLVELSVSLVLLLLLLSGAVEFGIAFFQFVQLRDAAQEGALYGSTKPDDVAGMIDRIEGSSDTPIDLPTAIANGDVDVFIRIDDTIEGYPTANPAYATVDCEAHALTVRVEYVHNVFMPFMCPVLGLCTIPLNATVTDTILSPYACTP